MMRRLFLQRIIPALFACALICVLSVGFGMAQSLNPTAANTKRGLFLNKAPAKSSPKEVSAASAPSNQNVADPNKPAAQPSTQIKLPPVRITLGGAQNNKSASLPTIKVSPQDIAKVQKIMELMNIGPKTGR
jgi:hypothetical protein